MISVRTSKLRQSDNKAGREGTRLDTQLHKSRAGGQGPYLRSLHHLGRSCEAKDRKKEKSEMRWTDGRTDKRTDKAGC